MPNDIPQQERIRKLPVSLHAATSALWMPVDKKKLPAETAASIAEWAAEELEGLIRVMRVNVGRFNQIWGSSAATGRSVLAFSG